MPREDVGKVAWARTADGAVPGVVVEWRGDRARVLVESGGRETWTEDRIFWVSGARVPRHSAKAAIEALAAFRERVEESAEGIDLAELWDLLAPDGGNHYPEDLAAILFTDPGIEHDSAVARALAMDDVYFAEVPGGAWTPRSPEAVEQALAKRAKEKREDALVGRVSDLLREVLDGPDGPAVLEGEAAMGAAWLKALAVDGADRGEGKRGARVLEGVLGGKVSDPRAGAFDLLVDLGVFHEDEILGIHANRIRTAFPLDVLDDAEGIAAAVMDDPEVTNRRAIEPAPGSCGPVSIDDPWTTEVDDALMVEDTGDGARVHVLIADPGAGIALDSPTGIEGINRAATLYLPTGKHPMLPPVLSEGALSLRRGCARPMLDFACDLSPDGGILGFSVEPVIGTIETHLTYDEADGIIDGEDRGPVATALRTLDRLAVALRSGREAAGALIIPRDDVSVRVEDGEIVVHRLPWASPARRLVSEFMVLACTLAGRFARENGIPAVYRSQDPPDDPDAVSGLEPGTRPYCYRMVRTMRRAVITTTPDFHYGMGVVGYTQVTSPLRRFQDLVVQAQIKGFLKGGRPPLDRDRLLSLFGDLENRGDAVTRTEREARRYYLLKALGRSIGGEVSGEVLAQQGSRAIVEIDDLGLEVPVPGAGRLKPGAKARIKVLGVDPRLDKVFLQLA